MPSLLRRNSSFDEYPDDIFKESRMSFGDHLDELRTRMLRALKYFTLFLVFGLCLDGLGYLLHNPKIGIGRPMMAIITDPVEEQVRDFYNRRNEKKKDELLNKFAPTPEDEAAAIKEKLKRNDNDLSSLTSEEKQKLLGIAVEVPLAMSTASLAPAFGTPRPDAPAELNLKVKMYPAYISYLSNSGEAALGTKHYLSTMSFQEAFIVYFKVAMLCSVVLGCPFILYQFWAFVGAGLYPHEKRYVYLFFGPSVGLFVFGCVLCQFLVLPGAIKALLGFNNWLELDADIRLSEWLGLAVLLPLIFGVSFQTPLVMVFLNRIGMFTAKDYLAKWRYACFIIVLFAAIVTPTPDVITMAYLFIPMFGLYLAGILVCYWFPPASETQAEVEASEEVAV